jgi:gliding motility-associated-like protein
MNIFLRFFAFFLTIVCMHQSAYAEGSKDLVADKGYRLFYNAQQNQQLKVYAGEGEFIQVGSSHIGVSGGFIRVLRPDGTLHTIFNNNGPTAGLGIIYNKTQEFAGPTGGGTLNGPGYVPGVISVQSGEEGVWTVLLEYPAYTTSAFNNVLNVDNWSRIFDQPLNQRVVLAWDITVSKNKAANEGGDMVTGRVFTQEYISVINDNGNVTDSRFFVLTDEGLQYRLDLEDFDPWGWFISSNNRGVVTADKLPTQSSWYNIDYIRSWLPENWSSGNRYIYEPQTVDSEPFSNNKLFFNEPDPDMPESALVYDVFRNRAYSTWLLTEIPDFSKPLYNVDFNAEPGPDGDYSLCGGYIMGVGVGGYISFETSGWGMVELKIDINQNGNYNDPEDVTLSKAVAGGKDSLFWNGFDNLGEAVLAQENFPLNLSFSGIIYSGEVHFMLFDVENISGGLTINRLNGINQGIVPYYYDHVGIGGSTSGGGTPGNALPTTDKYTYSGNLGDEAMMDYWSYISAADINEVITLYIDIIDDCTDPDLDSDGDGIIDFVDLDDDNDGIPDSLEYCSGTGFHCLPGGFDPSHDEDGDRVPNYLDADDPAVNNPCVDLDGDGICDSVHPIYDKDGDGVPNHLDLDSDNDGISDLDEAKHNGQDISRNGRIDGPNSDFGDNGLYNAISNKPNGLDAVVTYTLPDRDNDGVPDNEDRDADNDGIFDVAENGNGLFDTSNDGGIDDGSGNPGVDKYGVPLQLSPLVTGLPWPVPLDSDGDGIPNQNDRDSDNDGILDVTESMLPDPDGDGILGAGVPTVDMWGAPRFDQNGDPLFPTSYPVNTDGLEGPDFIDLDSDGDGIWDSYEADVYDPDYDGIAGYGVPIVDLYGVPVIDENGDPLTPVTDPPDWDNDGLPNFQDRDSDNDGISDGYECYDYKNGIFDLPCLDTDGDGVPDIFDLDSDDDGLPDTVECPGGDNPDCPDSSGNGIDDFRDPNKFVNNDTDGDGIPDRIDIDNDNDGIPDHLEFCPEPGYACLPGGVDPDGDEDQDNIPNFMDADDAFVNNPCVDLNADGICDFVHAVYDTDGDGIPNHNDLDSDNDGIPDMFEAGHNVPSLSGNGMINAAPIEFGLNGLYNPISTDPNSPLATITYTLRDSDLDNVFDFRDLDSDNDGITDCAEIGYQAWDSNNDGRIDDGNGNPDISWMGIPRVVNSVWTGNPIPMPRDTDLDGVPNYRDIDSDNDGIHDVAEQGVVDQDQDGMPGISPVKVDGHGRVEADATGGNYVSTSAVLDTDNDGTPDFIDLDSDGDSIPDVLEAEKSDPDQDGKPGQSPVVVNTRGALVSDALGNALSSISNPRDLDKDGLPDFQDVDRDGDGISDGYECIFPYACVDTDGDGTPDVDDLNSDGDCDTDAEECPGGDPCPDSNGNGIPDFRFFECCPDLSPLLEVADENQVACSGRPIVLTGTNINPLNGLVTYTWTGPGFSFTNTVSSGAPFNATVIPSLNSPGTYTLSASSDKGCAGDVASMTLEVKPTPLTPSLQIDPLEVCINEELILTTQLYSGLDLTYSWYYDLGNGMNNLLGITTEPMFTIPMAQSLNSGFYTVIVSIDGCESDGANKGQVFVIPEANIQAEDDTFFLYLEDKNLEGLVLSNDMYNTGSVMVETVETSKHGKLTLFANGNFRYEVNSGYWGVDSFAYRICGELCQLDCDTAWVYITISNENVPVDCIPYNVITPNNDGDNDYLLIPCLDNYPEHEVIIFNRWGDEVFFSDNYKQDWDARWRGNPLEEGTYFYILKIFGAAPQMKQGYITIIR